MATHLTAPGWHLLAAEATQSERVLVVVQLSGGNDGLNTVVPYKDSAYYSARPKLAIASDSVVKLNDQAGLNPAARALESMLEGDRLCIVQGVGYPQPNRSHFESMDIWHTCQRKGTRGSYGWLGRMMTAARAQQPAQTAESMALHLGHEQQPLALASRDVTVPSIASLEQFRLQLGDRDALKGQLLELSRQAEQAKTSETSAADLLDFVQASTQTALQASDRLEMAARERSSDGEFPKSALADKLQIISQLILSGLSTRVYYVALDGFDTHAQQSAAHTALLRQWSEALSAFHARLRDAGQADRVLVMTFSEFGRRVAENASDGTDHGAAAPVFLSGPKMTASLLGAQPSLTDLDDGDLKFHTDFRSVYATIIENWFASRLDSQSILGEKYATLDVLPRDRGIGF